MASPASPTTEPLAPLPTRRLPRAVRHFVHTEASAGVVLVAAAVVALVWANSPWSASYRSFWATEIRLAVGDVERSIDLRHLVDEAFMALFFFVVGLEIKRELVVGELASWRRAALPAFAAVGGMVVPATLYALVNVGAPGARGWGIPMATDIAFALGVLALAGPRVPSSLKVFLLSLAIVDDIGAIVVIALVYSSDVRTGPLLLAWALVAVIVVLGRLRVDWMPVYVVLGVALWGATWESGIHATIAGVLLGLLAPARPLAPATVAREWAADLADDPSPDEIRTMTTLAKATVSVAERLARLLHPFTSFVVVPLFALANAGVRINGRAFETPGAGRVALGVVSGLVVGKVVGISMFSWLALRLRLGALADDLRPVHLVGVATVAGIGFTVSLFVAGLAFDRPGLEDAAKLAILAASVVASVAGLAVLRLSSRRRPA